ncbi:MAG TPA: lanthionine synthetase LanC family protein [Vicinamibacterales bacterium]|nr:lanthionine synthetase LanC family protein [Vicinamibacterales bacterium]
MRTRIFTVALLIAVVGLLASAREAAQTRTQPTYRDVAVDAAKWIRNSRMETLFGIAWPADPQDPKTVSTALYSGSPGVVLFLLELHAATGDAAYLADAKRGADELMTKVSSEPQMGLYTGVAGLGFMLGETWRATRDDKYRKAALGAVRILADKAGEVGKGVQWNNSNDIISGTAGIGLFLLYASDTLKEEKAGWLAVRAADRLLEVGIADKGGTKWAMDPNVARMMPNFSHGTAGIAYFLAAVHKATGGRRFLDGALSGARYLLAIAKTEGDICLVPHNQPDGLDLYYLGWCHGPAGTARLFYQLAQITGDKTWMSWVQRSANGVLTSGIPQQRTPGFWNNVSQCCGNAGVAQFMLDLHNVTREAKYLAFAERVTADLLARATRDVRGTRWVQAEHRVQPDLLVAQTGYMQGAAGIGMWLLRLDAQQRKRTPLVRFPDSPW